MSDHPGLGPQFHYYADTASAKALDPDGRIGIALSGGGVRAACLGLGALQRAEDLQVFRRASYLSSVSGGSYIATAFVASRATADGNGTRPWQKGSAEEAHLRRNLRYLAEDWSDQCLALARYVVRTAIHLVQFAAVLVLVGSSLGLLYRLTGLLTTDGELLSAGDHAIRYTLAITVMMFGAAVDRGTPVADTLLHRMRLDSRRIRRWVMVLVGILIVPDLVAVGTNLVNARKLDVAATAGWALVVLLGAVVMGAVVLRSQSYLPTSWLLRAAGWVLRLVFSISVLTIFVLPPLLLVALQASQPTSTAATYLGGAALVLLFCGAFVHANWTSLHSTYARRLARAYIVRHRPHPPGADACHREVAPQRLDSVYLEDLKGDDVPDLILCAAVNVGAGESALGEGCASFVFSHDFCGLPTGADLKDALATRSCAELVATSGAAIAPNMGRLTRRSARALLALMNLRLGLWVQVPRKVPAHLSGLQSVVQRARDRLPQSIVEGWREPGPLWTWREAFGDVSKDHAALFVSDGGHWDNSGIVELMRHRCRTIFAVDAAVDEMRLSNLLRAISLARTELGVEIGAGSGLLESRAPVLRLRFAYPDEDAATPKNQLIVMRTHLDDEMPADLWALSSSTGAGSGSGTFPRHVTVNQFLLARDVDAYITLGRWLFDKANEEADLPPLMPEEAAA